ENVTYFRISYAAVQALSLLILYYVRITILRKNDETPFYYTKAPPPMSGEKGEDVQTTVKAYDLEQLREQVKQTLIGIAIMAALHLHWGYIRPLFLQSVLGLVNLAQTPLFQVYILKYPLEGELARPWSKLGSGATATTLKDIKAREKKAAK
ncbi:hypothetical protein CAUPRSCDRAFT_2123, partial [Caulochytrium protostelioides]